MNVGGFACRIFLSSSEIGLPSGKLPRDWPTSLWRRAEGPHHFFYIPSTFSSHLFFLEDTAPSGVCRRHIANLADLERMKTVAFPHAALYRLFLIHLPDLVKKSAQSNRPSPPSIFGCTPLTRLLRHESSSSQQPRVISEP